MQVDFYHLVQQPLDHVLPRIAERVVAGGQRLLVVSDDADQRHALDRLLWTYAADSFLPHALAGGDRDADQPILIAAAPAPDNGARNLALVDGTWREAALTFARVFHLFDGERIADARVAWKALAGRAEVERRYWKQNDAGRWEQAA